MITKLISLGLWLFLAAAAKSLQSCLTLCDPIDGSPPGSPIPGILQARTLEWVAISFSNAWKWKVKTKSLSHVQLLVTPWTAAHQAPPSMGFSRQEYWSGVQDLKSEIQCSKTEMRENRNSYSTEVLSKKWFSNFKAMIFKFWWMSKLWCWRRLLRVPWTVKRSNQSILKEIRPEYSLEGLMLKLKLQYSGHLMGRADSLEKTLMLGRLKAKGKEGGRGLDG